MGIHLQQRNMDGHVERAALKVLTREAERYGFTGDAFCLMGVLFRKLKGDKYQCRIEVQLRCDLISHIACKHFRSEALGRSVPEGQVGKIKRQQRLQKILLADLSKRLTSFYVVVVEKGQISCSMDVPAIIKAPTVDVLMEQSLRGEDVVMAEGVIHSVSQVAIQYVMKMEEELNKLLEET